MKKPGCFIHHSEVGGQLVVFFAGKEDKISRSSLGSREVMQRPLPVMNNLSHMYCTQPSLHMSLLLFSSPAMSLENVEVDVLITEMGHDQLC